MILALANVLDANRLERLRALAATGTFADGKSSAGWHARLVKDNEQLAGEAAGKVEAEVTGALKRHEVFASAVLPRAFGPVLLSRYGVGKRYGDHVDDAIQGLARGQPVRTDVSVTVFLAPPGDYDGGELVIADTEGERPFKLEAGAAIVYPSTTLHRVEPVTRGERLAAVTWVQSLVREAACREILFDLDTARRALFREHGKSAEFDLLAKSYANLLRRWAEL
jgi:PKHD-type hydroxylase